MTLTASDYVAGSGALNFPVGVNSLTFTVTINGDTTFEPDETIYDFQISALLFFKYILLSLAKVFHRIVPCVALLYN